MFTVNFQYLPPQGFPFFLTLRWRFVSKISPLWKKKNAQTNLVKEKKEKERGRGKGKWRFFEED